MNKFLLQKAFDFHQKNQFKKALKLYLDIYECDANNYELIFLIGTIYLQISDYTQAILFFEKIQEDYTNIYHVYSNLGVAYTNVKDYESGEKYFLKSIQKNNKFSHCYNNLGNLYLRKKLYQKALSAYDNAIIIENNPEFHLNKARVFFELDLIDNTIKEIDKISINYKSVDLYSLKMDILSRLNENNKIINLFSSIERPYNQNEQIVKRYIQALIDSNNFKKVASNIKLLKSKNSQKYLLGLYHFKINNLNDAKNYFTELLQDNEYNYKALTNLGLISAYQGDNDLALDYYNKSLTINPNFQQALLNKGLILLSKKNFIEGWPLYKRRRKNLPMFVKENIINNEYDSIIFPSADFLIIGEQGLGDEIFYLQMIANKMLYGFDLLIDYRLKNIYTQAFPKLNFYSPKDHINFQKYKGYIFLPDLFSFFSSNIQESEILIQEFKFNLPKVKILQENNDYKIIGISWKSFKNDTDMKNISLSHIIDKLIHSCDNKIRFVNLQYGDTTEDFNQLRKDYLSYFLDHNVDLFNDIESLFYLINQCDFIVTIGNITSHISGTLGKKSYVFLPENISSIWYWHDEKFSSWYPNSRLLFFNESNLDKLIIDISAEINELT